MLEYSSISYYYLIPGLFVLASPILFLLASSTSLHSQQRTHLDNKRPTATTDSSSKMTHTIVILGGGVTGVPLAHHLLKHTPASVGLRVVLVSPNKDLFWCFATVRGILPDMLGDDKLFLPIDPAFAKYGSRFEHVLGTAEQLDPDAKTVVVAAAATGGEERKEKLVLHYDTVVVATGSSFREAMPFKNLSTTQATKDALHGLQARIAAAKSIVVAGAGETGSEVAGELGQEYGIGGRKTITLISHDTLPLSPEIKPDVRRAVVSSLTKLNVRFLPSTRVVSAASTSSSSGRTTLTLRSSGGETSTLEADLYIPTFGTTPNTSFLPPELLDPSGRVRVSSTLQAPSHPSLFALGDACALESPTGLRANDQLEHLAPALQRYLAAADSTLPTYKPRDGVILALSLGRRGGTGQMGSWRICGWLIWLLKARHLGTDKAADLVAGLRTMASSKWA